jgi:hypothetical protein
MLRQTIRKVAKRLLAGNAEWQTMQQCNRLAGYLGNQGWFRSVELGLPVDGDGNCLPWFTYCAISFLTGRVRPEMTVFEYGSGHSTLWWSGRVKKVVSYEHDSNWFATLKPRIPANVDYFHVPLEYGGDYSKAILGFQDYFDIIVIDGRDRVQCAKNSLGALRSNGVIIWDNSDRTSYAEGYQFLADHGFKQIDFQGLGPINDYQWTTSVFYRDLNCLSL